MADKMILGYLHIGPPWHGVCRYGRLLAAEAHQQPELTVIEADVILTEDRRNPEMLIDAAKQLSTAEIIHIQYSFRNNKALWGTHWKMLYYLWLFSSHCSCPLVVTLHDIYSIPPSLKTALKLVSRRLGFTASSTIKDTTATPNESPSSEPLTPAKAIRFIQFMIGSRALSLRWLLNQIRLVFVCSEEEAKRLSTLGYGYKTRIVPHFVEKRLTINPIEAKAVLKLNKVKTVTLLGFIHPLKGHQLVIEALPELPQNVKVVFAGGPSPGNEKFVEELVALANTKKVGDRLIVTGYLSEQELECYLAATDLAVCPFKSISASGSLSTWISASRQILAYDLPQISEYNKLEHNCIKTFQPYTPTALAQAIKQLLVVCPGNEEPAIARLQEKLSISVIFNEHLKAIMAIR